MKVLLVGTGNMGREYGRVLMSTEHDVDVVGRGGQNADQFENEFGVHVIRGGIERGWNELTAFPDAAIIAVGDYQLCEVCKEVIRRGVKRILLEKPGGTSLEELVSIKDAAKIYGCEIYVAYNRRFYQSVQKAIEIIEEDGGVTSFHFEFTEWLHKFKRQDGALKQLLYGNSGHVIDLAFFIGGKPRKWNRLSFGEPEWENNQRKQFAGSGVSEREAFFTYNSNWDSPGRWRIEVLTKEHRLYFCPLEKLQIQKQRTIEIIDADIDYSIDEKFKPGLYFEVMAFLSVTDDKRLIKIDQQIENWQFFGDIMYGSKE